MDGIDRASILYYSDDPEKLSVATQGHIRGVLFDFDIVAGAPQRFVLYHVNEDDAERTLALRFFNMTDESVQVSYVKSLPSPDEGGYLSVGHASTFDFLRRLAADERTITDVAPGENAVPQTIVLPSGGLASGIFEFTLVVGSSLRCSLVSAEDEASVLAAAESGRAFAPDGYNRRGRFNIADKTPIEVTAPAGTLTQVVRLGQRCFDNLEKYDGVTGSQLKGEYGVFTAITLTIVNDTDAPASVALYESAHGGISTASYLIDGVPAESGEMFSTTPYPRHKVACYTVAPNSQHVSSILTMPDNASNSPVVLTLDVADSELADPGTPGSIVTYYPSEKAAATA